MSITISETLTVKAGRRAVGTLTPAEALDFAEDMVRKAVRQAMREAAGSEFLSLNGTSATDHRVRSRR